MPYNEPIDIINTLSRVTDIELILVDTNITLRSLRFLPNDDKDVDIWLSRDLDSMLNNKEKAAIDDWLTNYPDKMLHLMHDNTQHTWTILAGMFGVKNNHENSILNFIFENRFEDVYDTDALIAEKFFYKDNNYIQHYGSGKKLLNSLRFPEYIKDKDFGCIGSIDSKRIEKYYLENELYRLLIKNDDIFYYKPWNTNCTFTWINNNADFMLKPIQTPNSTSCEYSSLITQNGDGIRLMKGEHINVLWDNRLYKEVYLSNDQIIIIHDKKEYVFEYISK
jgi:hypothetical protein